MAINKVIYGGNTLIDLTADTVTAADLMQGKTAHGADGEPITGTYTPGGGSDAELIWTEDAELTVTSTSAVSNLLGKNIPFVIPEGDAMNYYYFLRVRDVEGGRTDYYYGSDTIILNIMNTGGYPTLTINNLCYKQATATRISIYAGNYGIYPFINQYSRTSYSLRIDGRYYSSRSGTIDGTYRFEFYKTKLAGKSPYEL
jgi:hypothetical protein